MIDASVGPALGSLLPSAVAIALSPIPIVAIVLVLGSPRARTSGPAFVLGWVTKCYRDAHPSPTPIQTHSGKSRVSRSSSAKVDQQSARNAGEAARRTRKSAEKLDLSDSATKQERRQK